MKFAPAKRNPAKSATFYDATVKKKKDEYNTRNV
jgi:hypothetical protein